MVALRFVRDDRRSIAIAAILLSGVASAVVLSTTGIAQISTRWLVVTAVVAAFMFGSALLKPRLLAHFAFWYVILFTIDVKVGGVPIKVPLLGICLIAWLMYGTRTHYEFTRPVLFLALVVPLVWSVVARLSSPPSEMRFVVAEGSRFVYLLLYFPLAELVAEKERSKAVNAVVVPVFALCAVTSVLWIGHVIFKIDYGYSGRVFAFQGVIEDLPSHGFRLFFGNHILLIPAIALVLALLMSGHRSRLLVLGLAWLLVTVYLTQTRGLWLGVLVVLAMTIILAVGRGFGGRALALFALAVALGIAVPVVRSSVSRVFTSFSQTQEASIAQRYEQAPVLWDAFKRSPVIGNGLGATIPGLVRSEENPWSFELTYLQMLFQLGLVGMVCFLAVPAVVAAKSLTASKMLPSHEHGLALGAVAGMLGLLVSSATNPYLLSSYGMASFALLLAIADRQIRLVPREGVSQELHTGGLESLFAGARIAPTKGVADEM